MEFDDRTDLDTSQVQDLRGGRGGGGGGGLGGALLGTALGRLGTGGGVLGVVVALAFYFLSGSSGSTSGFTTSGTGGGTGSDVASCRTGADANAQTAQAQDCRLVADVDAVQAFWTTELPKHGVSYRPATTRFLDSTLSTGCGPAGPEVGPFYCPADGYVYLDPGFFAEFLQGRLGAKGGAFAELYVLAHEYGHHVQDLLGTEKKVDTTQTGPTSGSVRLELQADCYAGVFTHGATRPGADGRRYITSITDQDIADGIDAARAVGDDYIQSRGGGTVHTETFTHGTSAQREKWFRTGYTTGDLAACDTFAATTLG